VAQRATRPACHATSDEIPAPAMLSFPSHGMVLGGYMRRREFIAGLGGACAWPVAARAQRSKPALMGLLGSGTAAAQSEWTAAFVQRLREFGWSEGRNLTIEYRWAEGRSADQV
jgi:hypothetical protein